MDEAAAWSKQADADRLAAERERAFAERSKPRSWCHTIAKYQQAVEKSIKSIVAALRECGVRVPPIGYDHRVQDHLRLLRRLPGGGAGRSIQNKRRRKGDRYKDLQMLSGQTTQAIVFLGGKDYVPLFCSLTDAIGAKKTVFFNSAKAPTVSGCVLKRFETNTRTNWHYECASALLDGSVPCSY